jgi:CheY-like chemotaxis protein
MDDIKQILIVDDIFTNRLLLSEILKDLNYGITQASNGREAVELIAKNDFDLVLMDIEMPVMNGLETTKYIREEMVASKSKIPIVALTAHNPNLFFEDHKHAGFNELLTKPYSISKIKDIINSVLVKNF